MARYELKLTYNKQNVEEQRKVFKAYTKAKQIKDIFPHDYSTYLTKLLKSKIDSNPYPYSVELSRKTNYGVFKYERKCSTFDKIHKAAKTLKTTIINDLRTKRRESRRIEPTEVPLKIGFYSFGSISKSGGLINLKSETMKTYGDATFRTPVAALKYHLRNTSDDRIRRSKIPCSNEKHVGIEIEFLTDESRGSVQAEFVNSKIGKHCQIKTDGSLRTGDYSNSLELALIDKENNIFNTIKTACEILNSAPIHAALNGTCGLHIHLDIRDYSTQARDKLWEKFMAWQETMYAMNPRSRDGEYSHKNSRANDSADCKVFPRSGTDRYNGISSEAYYSHKTIEIRMHTATTNAKKIINWIKVLLAIRDCPDVPKEKGGKLTCEAALKKYLKMDNYLTKYVIGRVKKFGNKVGDNNIIELEQPYVEEPIEEELRLAVNSDIGDDNNYEDYDDDDYHECTSDCENCGRCD